MRKIIFISSFLLLACESIFALQRADTPAVQDGTRIKNNGERQTSQDKIEDKALNDDSKTYPEAQKNKGERQRNAANAGSKDVAKDNKKGASEKQKHPGKRQKNSN